MEWGQRRSWRSRGKSGSDVELVLTCEILTNIFKTDGHMFFRLHCAPTDSNKYKAGLEGTGGVAGDFSPTHEDLPALSSCFL